MDECSSDQSSIPMTDPIAQNGLEEQENVSNNEQSDQPMEMKIPLDPGVAEENVDQQEYNKSGDDHSESPPAKSPQAFPPEQPVPMPSPTPHQPSPDNRNTDAIMPLSDPTHEYHRPLQENQQNNNLLSDNISTDNVSNSVQQGVNYCENETISQHRRDSVYDFTTEENQIENSNNNSLMNVPIDNTSSNNINNLGPALNTRSGMVTNISDHSDDRDSFDNSNTIKSEPRSELNHIQDDSSSRPNSPYHESFDDSLSEMSEYPNSESCYDNILVRRGRGRPRGSKNGSGMGRSNKEYKDYKEQDDRTCAGYDLRSLPDPFAGQRRGRPRSRFIVDLGEQNHDAWTKAKEELNISDGELTTLLLSLLESRKDCSNEGTNSDTLLDLVNAEYSKWKEKFSTQVSMLSHYSSIHNTNCCTCLGIKKKKYIPAGTGKRGRPRKYPPPVGYGPGMQRPDGGSARGGEATTGASGTNSNMYEPQIILKDGMVVKNEPGEDKVNQMNDPMNPDCPKMDPSMSLSQLPPRPSLSFEEIEKRREYYNNHKNKIKYVCHYCQVHFYHKPNFDFHIRKLESTGKCRIYEKMNNLYLCETCGEGFSWREKLEKHLRLAEQHGTHNQKELLMYGDFQCNMCAKTFNKRTTYLQHVKWHEDRDDIPCVICGSMFKQVDLRKHLMDIHSNDSLPCTYCGKLFTNRKYLEKHELVHQGGNFPCPECGKTFSQKGDMQAHLKNHSLEKDLSCDTCGQIYNQRSGICAHLKKLFAPHEYNDECEVCGQFFAHVYDLKIHKKKIHNMPMEGIPDNIPEHQEYMTSPMSSHIATEDDRDKYMDHHHQGVKNMMGMSPMNSSINLTMKNEVPQEPMDDSHMQMRENVHHIPDHMRHMSEQREPMSEHRETPVLEHEHMRMAEPHPMHVNEDHLHMPQDLTRMSAQSHLSDSSGRMSAAPQSHMGEIRPPVTDSPARMSDTPHMPENLGRVSGTPSHMNESLGRMSDTPSHLSEGMGRMSDTPSHINENMGRMSDTPSHLNDGLGRMSDTPSHMNDNLGRMAAENFSRMASPPSAYLAEHLRRMAENQSRMTDSMSHYDERDNYTRLGENLRSMSRGSAADSMGRLGDNLSHMGVIRPTNTPTSTPQWPPHMQNHMALEGMNQGPQPNQHAALYPLPFWPYDPSLRQYHH